MVASDLATKEELIRKWGVENEWFIDLLFLLRELKVQREMPITDLLIRENDYVYFATIKAFQPLTSLSPEYRNFKPTRENIESMLRALGKDLELHLALKLSDPMHTLTHESIIDFSFAIKGLGIYRCNASLSENLLSPDGIALGVSIRILDFQVPDFDRVFYPPSFRKLLLEGQRRPISLVEEYKRTFQKLVGTQRIKRIEVLPEGIKETVLERKVVRTGGLILHVGSTGSGKTTTIASEIGYLAKETTGTIITYENPIEYRYVGFPAPIRQYEIGYHLKDDPAVIVKHLLRVNPSVVLYGEARTLQEMKVVLDVANRGHLVFSTIHANNVKEALGVLLSACEDETYLLANGLIMIVAHRLVLNRQGEIVPLFEVFSPDKVDRTALMEGDLRKIYTRFYQEEAKSESVRWTFKKYLEALTVAGIIDPEIKRELVESAPLVFNP